jgi:hypothetical protein
LPWSPNVELPGLDQSTWNFHSRIVKPGSGGVGGTLVGSSTSAT